MNKRALIFILIIFSFHHLFAQDALARIKKRGTLNVGILNEAVYPFIYQNSYGEPAGFEVIRSREIASLLGVSLQFKNFSDIEEVKKALNKGEVDISFHKRFRTLSDGLDCFLTLPIAEMEMALVVNRKAFASLKRQPDMRQRFLDGNFDAATLNQESFIGNFAKEFPFLNLKGADDEIDLWDAVKEGRHIGIYMDEARIKLVFEENPAYGLTLSYIPLGVTQEIVGLLSWKESFFLDWINIAIEGWGKPRNMQEILEIVKGEINE